MVMEWAILLWRLCLFRLRLSLIGNLKFWVKDTATRVGRCFGFEIKWLRGVWIGVFLGGICVTP